MVEDYPSDAYYLASQPEFWDPLYFFPRYFKVQPKRGGRVVPFELWPIQRILSAMVVRCYQEGKWLAHVKPRKEGSSTFFTGVLTQHIAFREGCQAVILAQREDVTRQLARTANRFWVNMPENMLPPRLPGVKRTIECPPPHDSVLELATVGQDDPGRGYTGIHAMVATEICKWGEKAGPDAWTSVLSNIPDPDPREPEGAFVVAESTPLYYGDELQKVWLQADEPDSPWLKCFIPWTMVHSYAMRPAPGWEPKEDIAEYAHNHGLTIEQAFWMQSVGMPKCSNRLEKFRAEYPINEYDCWVLAGDSVFNPVSLAARLKDLDMGTLFSEKTGDYQEWFAPIKGHRYVVFCDAAGSWSERDRFAVEVIDLTASKQVAEYLGHMTAHEMANYLAKMGTRYNRANVYVEANGVGEAVLSHLMYNEGYPRIFHYTPVSGGKPKPGWSSNKKTKVEAVSWTQESIDDGSIEIYSHRLLRQLAAYRGQWDKVSRDATGGHYDLVAAWCGCNWAWRHELGARAQKRNETDSEKAARNWRNLKQKIQAGIPKDGFETRWGIHR